MMDGFGVLPGIQFDLGDSTMTTTSTSIMDGSNNGNSSSLWSNDTATTTSPSDNIIMSPDLATGTQTTTPTNIANITSSIKLDSSTNGSENSTTTTPDSITTALTASSPPATATTTTNVVLITEQTSANVPTPSVIQAPPPNPAAPGNSCPDLRDRISIDISITTSTSSDKDGGAKNSATPSSTNRRADTEPLGTARSLASHELAPSGSQQNTIMASKQIRHGIILSTADHRVGTVVQVTCATDHHSVMLKCDPGGFWNATVPTCRGGLDTSPYRLYLTVAGAGGGLVLLVLFFLYCHLLRARRKGSKRGGRANSMRTRDTDHNLYVDPYHVGERLYGSPNSPHFARSDITYAKPIVYSTYLNPAFYEDAYERWRRQEQMVSERLYDSPWLKPRGLQQQMDAPGFKWSQTSLKTIGDSAFKKLPRAHIAMGHGSNMSHDSSRSRGPVNSQSSSMASMETGMLRLYPSMAAHDTRAHQMTSSDDALTEDNESLPSIERKSLDDGRTNF